MTKNYFYVIALALVASILLTGCQTSPKSLYSWGDYQPEVYSYFKGEDAEKQIITLEKNLDQLGAQGKLAPPGLHAHLGMLYANVGKTDLAATEFVTEKKLFPEATPYMDFLLNKKSKKKEG